MKCEKYLPALRSASAVRKRASPGERVLGSLFPSRGTGWPSGWGQDRMLQVSHYRHWAFVAIDTICSKTASIFPNLAYVVDAPKPGVTVKACQRGLYNLMGRGFGGGPYVGGELSLGSSWDYPKSTHVSGMYTGADGWDASSLMSGGGHSFLTVGEYRSKALSVVKPHEELEPLENDHRLRQLLENPNPVDTFFDLSYEVQMFEELCGVWYLWAIPNAWGVPCELWVIPSHWVWPRTGGQPLQQAEWVDHSGVRDGHRYVDVTRAHADELIAYYEIRPWGGVGSAGMLRIPPHEIITGLCKSPINKIDGYSKLSAISQWIDTEESISASRWSQFINQARPEFWIELAENYHDPSDDEISRIEAKIASKLQGEYNYGKPLITPPGAKVTPLSFNPTEMAYFQCHSSDTECLTSDGWKKYTELTTETRVACFDPATNGISYHKPSRVYTEHYTGPMHRWNSRFVDALMTPEHRTYLLLDPECNDFDSIGQTGYEETIPPSYRVRRVRELHPTSIYTAVMYDDRPGAEHPLVEAIICPEDRAIEDYNGDIWCVTVPTGFFIVRRNGKAHISGNSEEQIRDMILSTFRVPPSAVGIVRDMTFGSVLGTLMAMCDFCINPRLLKRGQTLTKQLAKRWDENDTTPAYSQQNGVGGHSSRRLVRIWYDDTAPVDPAQVNADLQLDATLGAITPNEVRAIRGRKPYRAGGDDPLLSGPGGMVPLPLNTGEDLASLAKLIAPMTAAEGQQTAESEGLDKNGQPLLPAPNANEEPAGEEDNDLATSPVDMDAGIEEPNGKPSKGLNGYHKNGHAKPHGDDDLPTKPDPVDQDLWQQCLEVCR